MRKLLVASVAACALLVSAPTAFADPPIGGAGAHPHHVMTPSGCVDINAVLFNPDTRGLHRGAMASGMSRGPWHGPCPTP